MLGHATDTVTVKNIVSEIDHQGKIEQVLYSQVKIGGEGGSWKISSLALMLKVLASSEILMDFRLHSSANLLIIQ